MTFHDNSTNFQASTYTSFNFHQISMRPLAIPSIFHVSAEPSLNVHRIYERLWVLPSMSVKFPCFRQTFSQLLLISTCLRDLPSITLNFPCIRIVHSRKNGQLPFFGALWLMTSLSMYKHGLKGFRMRRVRI